MQKVYYTRLKIASSAVISVALPWLIFILSARPPANAQQQSTSKPIITASLDSHEGLMIAADPWLGAERYKQAFPKKSPYAAGILAIKVTLRNDHHVANMLFIGTDEWLVSYKHEPNLLRRLAASIRRKR